MNMEAAARQCLCQPVNRGGGFTVLRSTGNMAAEIVRRIEQKVADQQRRDDCDDRCKAPLAHLRVQGC